MTRELIPSAIGSKTGESRTQLVVRPNCSVVVDAQPDSCDAVYPTTVIEDTLLLGSSAIGLVRRAATAAGAAGSQRLLYIAGAQFTDRELEIALQLSKQGRGYVVLRDPINVAGQRTSDLLIDGVRYDIYTPQPGTSAKRIISSLAKKNSQANGVVLDLSRSSVTEAELGNVLRRIQGAGATNIQDVIILR